MLVSLSLHPPHKSSSVDVMYIDWAACVLRCNHVRVYYRPLCRQLPSTHTTLPGYRRFCKVIEWHW
jgi:hypothetical protein